MKVACAPGYAIGVPISMEEKSASGLILQNLSDDFSRARLIVVGSPEITDHGTEIRFPFDPGDIVAFTGGANIRIDGQEAVVLSRKNVVCALWDDEDE